MKRLNFKKSNKTKSTCSPKILYTGPKQGLRPTKEEFDENIAKFVDLHFHTDGFHKGTVIVKVKRENEMKLAFFATSDDLTDRIQKLRFAKDGSYYISANSFTKGKSLANQAFTFHNIVIDIDCHRIPNMTGGEFTQMLGSLTYRLVHDFCHEYGIPAPNTVVYTGRGLQLWWALEPISAQCKKMYKYVAGFLVGQLCRILDEHQDEFSSLHVDKTASGGIAQLYRLPMTLNQTTGTYGRMEIIHEKRVDLAILCEEAHEYKKDKTPVYMHRFASGDPKGTADHRAAALFELVRMRLEEGMDITGYRDNFLFCLYNSVITANTDAVAMEKVAMMNAMFPCPLPEHEYVGYLSTSRHKAAANDPYLLKNTSIIGRLDITSEEQRHIRIFAAAAESSQEKRDKARAKKASRDAQILALSKTAQTKKEIADAVGCSESTVATVLKNHGKKSLKEKLYQSACFAIMKGQSLKEVAAKTGYTVAYIKQIIKLIEEKGYDMVVGKKHTPPVGEDDETAPGNIDSDSDNINTSAEDPWYFDNHLYNFPGSGAWGGAYALWGIGSPSTA